MTFNLYAISPATTRPEARPLPPQIGRLRWDRQQDGTYHALPTIEFMRLEIWHFEKLQAVGFGRKWNCVYADRRITFGPTVASPEQLAELVAAIEPKPAE